MTMGKGSRLRRERQQGEQSFSLSPSQRKAMNKEINRQVLERDKTYWLDIDAMTLWALHEVFGFGPSRLKRFFDAFDNIHEDLRKHYELSTDDQTWLVRQKLKDMGVDVAAWEKESKEKHEQ